MSAPEFYKVLIADDSEDDRFFVRRVLHRFPRFQVVGEVKDGVDAIAYLAAGTRHPNREHYPLPDLMLLDLKMPYMNGFEVLQWIRTRWFPHLSIVVLSSSNLADDIGASLALGAKGFWTKEADPKREDRIVKEIEELLDKQWLRWDTAPPPLKQTVPPEKKADRPRPKH